MKDVEDLTNQDRLGVYRLAREIYKREIILNPNGLPGMCWCIIKAVINLGINPIVHFGKGDCIYMSDLRKKYWPEFNALNTKNQGGYWWPRGDTESRLKAFDKLCKI
jgi:hypothetical protein